jgi:DNA repair exonuclease SbcCD nuclease subunit
MKLLITGDWHLDTQSPENRIDDYCETQFDKIKWIYGLAIEKGCGAILQPGDVFNSHRANDFLKWRYINFMRAMTRPSACAKPPLLYTIFGQHDLRYHSSARENTPLSVLEAAEVCHICQEDPYILDWADENYLVYIYGCNWGEEIPPVRKSNGVHILLIHKLVVDVKQGWEDVYLSIDDAFDSCEHDIIVCGDNHQSFAYHNKGRLLFNCGSLMRSRVDQVEHRPVVFIVDTEDRKIEPTYIPVKPIEDVLDVVTATRKKQRNEQLESFVNTLSSDDFQITGLDFKRNVYNYCKENEIDKETIDFINEVMS